MMLMVDVDNNNGNRDNVDNTNDNYYHVNNTDDADDHVDDNNDHHDQKDDKNTPKKHKMFFCLIIRFPPKKGRYNDDMTINEIGGKEIKIQVVS